MLTWRRCPDGSTSKLGGADRTDGGRSARGRDESGVAPPRSCSGCGPVASPWSALALAGLDTIVAAADFARPTALAANMGVPPRSSTRRWRALSLRGRRAEGRKSLVIFEAVGSRDA